VSGGGGIELFEVGQDRAGVPDGSLELNADRIEPGGGQELRRMEGSFAERRSLCGILEDADPGTGAAVEQGPIDGPPVDAGAIVIAACGCRCRRRRRP
jgi:hypothetical protein